MKSYQWTFLIILFFLTGCSLFFPKGSYRKEFFTHREIKPVKEFLYKSVKSSPKETLKEEMSLNDRNEMIQNISYAKEALLQNTEEWVLERPDFEEEIIIGDIFEIEMPSVPTPSPVPVQTPKPVYQQTVFTGFPIVRDGNIKDKWVQMAESQLAVLPQSISERFIKEDWIFNITDKDINKSFYGGRYSRVMGTTEFDIQQIYIENREKAIKEACLHEMGHFVFQVEGRFSPTEWNYLYDTYGKSFCEYYYFNHESYDIREFFAEAFYRYLTDSSFSEVFPEISSQLQIHIDRM